MLIREEAPGDIQAIRDIHLASFPEGGEADLVDRLRFDNDAVLSLVAAAIDGVPVGHALFSRMSAPFGALGLGPVAVLPEHRRLGVGAALIGKGVELAEKRGWEAVFALGDPGYYDRFGFSAQLARGFTSPYAGEYFMVLPLGGPDLPASSGRVIYADAFAGPGE